MQNAATVLDVLREIAGEPRAGKLARGVRTGGRWKRTRHQAGTSPAAYRCRVRVEATPNPPIMIFPGRCLT
jgi:hypothetical protein